MMIETVAYRQWRLFLGMDSLHLVLPLVMIGLAAGAIALHFINKSVPNIGSRTSLAVPDGTSVLLIVYPVLAILAFWGLPFSARLQSYKGFALACNLLFHFLVFFIWGYVNADMFDRAHKKIFRLYIASLLGTILGGCIAIVIMDVFGTPRAISVGIASAVISAWVWLALKPSPRRRLLTTIAVSGIVIAFAIPPIHLTLFAGEDLPVWFGSSSSSQLEVHPVEPLEVLRAPGRRIETSISPNVKAWRVDFDNLGFYHTNIIRYDRLEEVHFLSEDLSSLAFETGKHGRALILGAGGGIEVIQGVIAGYQEIDAVDINPLLVKAIRFCRAEGFMNTEGVRYHVADARRFILQDNKEYDLIFLPQVGGQGVSGIINNPYLYTVELMHRFLDSLSQDGTLVIRGIRRDWPSLLATIRVVLNARQAIGRWSVFSASEVRNRKKKALDGLLIIRQEPFSPEQVKNISAFVSSNGFTWEHVDMDREPDSRHIIKDDHPFDTDLEDILLGRGASVAKGKHANSNTIPLISLFRVPFGISLIIILFLVPMHFYVSQSGIRRVMILGDSYLIGLGSGFLAAEIVFIEKLFFVAGSPTLALTVTVSSLLGGATLSSWLGRNVTSQRLLEILPKVVLSVAPTLALAFFILEKLAVISGMADGVRLAFGAFVIFIPGILMGVLFPIGLRLLAEADQRSIPWSWAINGIAAAMGGIIAKILIISIGYRMALSFAVLCYILAAMSAWLLVRQMQKILRG